MTFRFGVLLEMALAAPHGALWRSPRCSPRGKAKRTARIESIAYSHAAILRHPDDLVGELSVNGLEGRATRTEAGVPARC